jgi:hypothetical protein
VAPFDIAELDAAAFGGDDAESAAEADAAGPSHAKWPPKQSAFVLVYDRAQPPQDA